MKQKDKFKLLKKSWETAVNYIWRTIGHRSLNAVKGHLNLKIMFSFFIFAIPLFLPSYFFWNLMFFYSFPSNSQFRAFEKQSVRKMFHNGKYLFQICSSAFTCENEQFVYNSMVNSICKNRPIYNLFIWKF